MPGKLRYSWDEFAVDAQKVARAVEGSGRKFSKIFAIPNGGLPLGVCLVNRLKPKPQLLLSPPVTEGVGFLVCDPQVLIVDDITHKGNVLLPYQSAGFFIATIFKHPDSKVNPQVWIREKDSRWVIFPWETEESSQYDGTLEKFRPPHRCQ